MEQLKEFEETLFSDEQLALELENELNFCERQTDMSACGSVRFVMQITRDV